MSENVIRALFCFTGLSIGAVIGWLVRVLLAETNRRLDQHQEPQ